MSKYSAELKIAACMDYLSGELSHREICKKYGIHFNTKKSISMLNEWIPKYMKHGNEAFVRSKGNDSYSVAFKEKVVVEYLSGEGSLTDIAAKYNIPTKETIRQWVLLYNANRELKDYCPKSLLIKSQVEIEKSFIGKMGTQNKLP